MASRNQFNSKSPTIKRILREASELANAPSPDYTAEPLESDLFEWHFTLRGPPSSAFATGIYHGRIVLPPTYPLRPPSFRFLTPSGRFETNREICLSISGHHEETWQPAWGLRTALVALRSFMETDAKGQLGGLETGEAVRKRMAGESLAWKCGSCGKSNEEILRECAEAAKANEEDGRAKKEEEVVPEELRMGFKDEMEKGKDGVVTEGCRRAEEDEESAELAEGFVQTGPIVAAVDPAPASVSVPAPAYPPARPVQMVPQPTATVPIPVRQTVQVQATQQRQRQSNDGVPLWIDRTIAGIVVCLIFMVLKMLLGSKYLI